MVLGGGAMRAVERARRDISQHEHLEPAPAARHGRRDGASRRQLLGARHQHHLPRHRRVRHASHGPALQLYPHGHRRHSG